MTLEEFLDQTQGSVRAEVEARSGELGTPYPYPEMVFTEIVMQHMSDIGMSHEPQICHHISKAGNATLRLSGYAVSEEADQLDLFVSLYGGVDEVTAVPEAENKAAAEQWTRVLARRVGGQAPSGVGASHRAHTLREKPVAR